MPPPVPPPSGYLYSFSPLGGRICSVTFLLLPIKLDAVDLTTPLAKLVMDFGLVGLVLAIFLVLILLLSTFSLSFSSNSTHSFAFLLLANKFDAVDAITPLAKSVVVLGLFKVDLTGFGSLGLILGLSNFTGLPFL